MNYLIPVALLLALCGCEQNHPGLQDSAEVAASPGRVVSGKTHSDADKPLKGHVSRPGLYRLVRSGGVIHDPSTGTGKSTLKPVVELIRTTGRIPLIKGGQMYLQYRIWPLPAQPAYVELRRVLKHPAMTLPDGTLSMGSDYLIKGRVSANQVIAYTGYGLDEDYELVEGDWIFEIWHQDKKVVEQKFTTYRPDEQELAKLNPLLALGNKALGQAPSPRKPFSRRDWPRISVGGTQSPAPTGALNETSGKSE